MRRGADPKQAFMVEDVSRSLDGVIGDDERSARQELRQHRDGHAEQVNEARDFGGTALVRLDRHIHRILFTKSCT